MPEMRTYIVTQTREVEVSANSVLDASRLADVAFEQGQAPNGSMLPGTSIAGMWGNTDTRIRTVSIFAEEKRYGVPRKI